MRNFDEWLSEFKGSISTWNYYVDFDKVYKNVDMIKVELNILNSLIGSLEIEQDFKKLLKDYPEVLKVIPILLAKREKEIKVLDVTDEYNFCFKESNYSIDDYTKFMKKTGIFNLLQNKIISDLTDYVKGVEVGMDTNARKNRTGKAMENIVENYIIEAGYVLNESYFKEITLKDVEGKYGVDLSTLSNQGKSVKRFDFVVKTENSVYAFETNFYSGGGSKLNETARSYEMIATQSKDIAGFNFIWITDGKGWLKARNNLRQTFDMMDDIYNLNDLRKGILKEILV